MESRPDRLAVPPRTAPGGIPEDSPEASGSGRSSMQVAAGYAAGAASRTSALMEVAMPRVGEVPFLTFVVFAAVLFAFTAFTDTILVTVAVRAHTNAHFDFPMYVIVLNGIWIFMQISLFADLLYVFFRYYRPRPKDDDKPKIGNSQLRMPKTWYCLTRFLNAQLNPRTYLLMLSLLLPLNALFFYNGLGRPVYTPSRLEEAGYYNITALVEPDQWPTGSGLTVDRVTWEVFRWTGTARISFTPKLFITSTACYNASSPEYRLLGQLRLTNGEAEDYPKQAYCEALIGTMMAGSFAEPSSVNEVTWQQDEDKWDEAFEFALRLFSSLAGVVADQTEGVNTMLSLIGLSFLKDMTDVFDMFMLTFADVDQMHEGRPLLNFNHGLPGYQWSFHGLVQSWIWAGVAVVLMRALAVIGFTPFVYILRCGGCTAPEEELRKPIDAFFSMCFIEIPYLSLRWIAWYRYGVPVSVMAVKNILGLYEDLFFIGIFQGFGGGKARGIRLLCARREKDPEDLEVPPDPRTS